MEFSLEKAERAYLKLILGGLGAIILLVVICWGGFHFYQRWQERHLVRRARGFLSGGDFNTASLNARRAIRLNPDDPEATRLVAELGEKAGDRSALDWRKRALELDPNSVDDALALARCAMRFDDIGTAERTLNALGESVRQKPEFQAASGRLAEMKRDMAGAEAHWAKAVELAPNDTGYRFQFALVRLDSRDPAKRKEALATLQELRSDPQRRAVATRSLIIDGIAHRANPQQARQLAKELQEYPDALFSDRILYVEILRQMRDPGYNEYLAHLKAEVPGKPAELASLLSWMIRNGGSAEALAFAQSLPATQTDRWPVPLALAEAHAQTNDWTGLEQLTKSGTWSGYDFLRRAYLARAFRKEGRDLAAEQALIEAQKAAEASPQSLSTLTQTIAEWGWQKDAVELLWLLTKNPETRTPALEALYAHYTKTVDTSGLYRTLARFAELKPDDERLQNNLAQISLLLGADMERARKSAEDLAMKEPKNAAYVSTAAFARLTKGDVKGARQLMDGLSAEQLQDPSVATYYGLILAAAGEKEKAREFLSHSSEANLLPEEKALVTKAESTLD